MHAERGKAARHLARLIATLRAFERQGYGLDLALAAADEAAVRC